MPQTAAQQARILLDFFGPDGEKWCQDALARDVNGHGVFYTESSAVRWCVYGAASFLNLDAANGQSGDSLWSVLCPDGFCSAAAAVRFNNTSPWPVFKAKLEEIAAQEAVCRP